MSNDLDFKRPNGIENGVLLNTNTEALQMYKRTKKRFATVTTLEADVMTLKEEIAELRKIIHDRNN